MPIFYAAVEGQAHRIAEVVATRLSEAGIPAFALAISDPSCRGLNYHQLPAFILCASVHYGRHSRAAERFVREHAPVGDKMPQVFLSVSMAASSRELEGQQEAQGYADAFLKSLQWQPQLVPCLAGRLAYSQYGWLKRRLMKTIAQRTGAPTDLSQDHEFTDWQQVALLSDEIVALLDTGGFRQEVA